MFFGAIIIQSFKSWKKEVLFSWVMLATLLYFLFFLEACLLHLKHAIAMGYSLLQVEDVLHFLLLVEIVTFISALLATFFLLLFASCRNDKQAKPIIPGRNNGFNTQPTRRVDGAPERLEG
jgi:hypothetical protein